MDSIKEENTKKGRFLLPFEMNGSSLRSTDQSQILWDTISQI